MSWICPYQIKENYCRLRNKECKPGSEGCTLSKKFNFIEEDIKNDNSKLLPPEPKHDT